MLRAGKGTCGDCVGGGGGRSGVRDTVWGRGLSRRTTGLVRVKRRDMLV